MHLKKRKRERKKGEKRSRKDDAQARSVLSLSVVLAVQIDCESSRMYGIAIISWIKAWGGNDRCRKRPLFI